MSPADFVTGIKTRNLLCDINLLYVVSELEMQNTKQNQFSDELVLLRNISYSTLLCEAFPFSTLVRKEKKQVVREHTAQGTTFLRICCSPDSFSTPGWFLSENQQSRRTNLVPFSHTPEAHTQPCTLHYRFGVVLTRRHPKLDAALSIGPRHGPVGRIRFL